MVQSRGLSPQELYNRIQRTTFSHSTKSHNGVPNLVLLDVRESEAYHDGHIRHAKFYGVDHNGVQRSAPEVAGADVVMYGDRESLVRIGELCSKMKRSREANSVRTLVAFFEEFRDSYPFIIVTSEEEEIDEHDDNDFVPFELTYPTEVISRKLYLSDGNQAQNAAVVNRMGITHIVNATPNMENKFAKTGIKYFRVPVTDSSVSDMTEHFDRSYRFIKKALEKSNKNKVLVHCSQGISRSATLVIYYIMREQKKSLEEAKAVVTASRPWVWPNEGFMRQLVRAGKELEAGNVPKKAGGGGGCMIQ